ncbi:NADP-binding protein [Dacryopinax primogenitus]|uniref:NADP-binding protein n=1 Tax=Dacryopinax primogenitus (strain DJM 731) TaxID=1858805 RepID=M5FWP6_DACPD|nr:NADP-binding protein [Dacryopinax primogenitus]EJU02376.1 NADP-binding protein [Dacryopinax primogenitus]
MTRIIITGASGVLGSAVYAAFSSHYTLLGLSHSSPDTRYTPIDLLDPVQVQKVWNEFNPDWVIHCAAERRPDVADKDSEKAQRLNAGVPAFLARLAAQMDHSLIYISTDYVFPGTSPPYLPSSTPDPLNLYGRTKLAGEHALLSFENCSSVRVPVLYGPVKKSEDSAINVLEKVVRDQSGKQYKMDDWQVRYPTNVLDVATFLRKLVELGKPLPKIIHFSAPHKHSKYTLCLAFSQLLSLPCAHITPDTPDPASTGQESVKRPKDCRLDMRETEELLGVGEGEAWDGVEVVRWLEGWFNRDKGEGEGEA